MSQTGPSSSRSPQPHPSRGGQPGSQPHRWNVILLNDDDHSYEYVIRMMQELFYLTQDQALKVAEQVDTNGRAIVFTTHREHAELKAEQIHGYGRDPQLPKSKGSMSALLEPSEA